MIITNPQIRNLPAPVQHRSAVRSDPLSGRHRPVTAIDTFTKPLSSLRTLSSPVDTTTAYDRQAGCRTRMSTSWAVKSSFQAGFQFDQRTKAADEQEINLTTRAAIHRPSASPPTTMPSRWTSRSWARLPMGYTFRYFDTLTRCGTVTDAARVELRLHARSPANNYKVQRAGARPVSPWARWSKADWGSVVGGVRVEQLDNRGTAVATVGTATSPVTADASHTLVFPSLHINYNVDDSKKLRLSFNSGAARADYDQLRPNVVVNDTNLTISGGNPAVKPERAQGVDAYLEWYIEPQGYLMAGVFYKEVQDVLYTQRRTFGSDALDSGGIDRSGYAFSGITNGGTGRLFGLEAAAQLQLEPWTEGLGLPEWMGGFGISANLTVD